MTVSAFDRLARRPVNRVTTRIAERLRCRFRCRNSDSDDSCEKQTKKLRHWLNVFATTNRVWQTISSTLVYTASAHLALNSQSETSGNGADHTMIAAVHDLAIKSLTYHVNLAVLLFLLRRSQGKRGWRFFSLATIMFDLLMMGLSMCKMNILSAAGVLSECHGQEKSGFFKSLVKNTAAFAHSQMGWGSSPENGEMDATCCLSKIVYILCGIAIFSYTFSILFTSLLLQRHCGKQEQQRHLIHPGFVEEAIIERSPQVHLVMLPQQPTVTPRPSMSVEPVQQQVPPSQTNYASRRSFSSFRTSASEDLPRYGSPPNEPFSIPQGRSSQETTSSFDPELYLVSDGFRPAPELPTYSSRPPSLRSGPPSYSSRPSSIRNV